MSGGQRWDLAMGRCARAGGDALACLGVREHAYKDTFYGVQVRGRTLGLPRREAAGRLPRAGLRWSQVML